MANISINSCLYSSHHLPRVSSGGKLCQLYKLHMEVDMTSVTSTHKFLKGSYEAQSGVLLRRYLGMQSLTQLNSQLI